MDILLLLTLAFVFVAVFLREMEDVKFFFEMAEKKDQILEEKDQVIRSLHNEIRELDKKNNQEIRELAEKKGQIRELDKKCYEEKSKNAELKNQLGIRNTEYLRVTRSLHIRSVCEEFETSC
jgi:peptidoglycan hydrolase CwlO-like protein